MSCQCCLSLSVTTQQSNPSRACQVPNVFILCPLPIYFRSGMMHWLKSSCFRITKTWARTCIIWATFRLLPSSCPLLIDTPNSEDASHQQDNLPARTSVCRRLGRQTGPSGLQRTWLPYHLFPDIYRHSSSEISMERMLWHTRARDIR